MAVAALFRSPLMESVEPPLKALFMAGLLVVNTLRVSLEEAPLALPHTSWWSDVASMLSLVLASLA